MWSRSSCLYLTLSLTFSVPSALAKCSKKTPTQSTSSAPIAVGVLRSLARAADATDQEANLLIAIACQESGRRLHPPGSNDNGLAQGLFQFHKARWYEFSKADWRTSSAEEQVTAMVKVIKHVRKQRSPKTAQELIIAVSRFHNIGSCKAADMRRPTDYSRSVGSFYEKATKTD